MSVPDEGIQYWIPPEREASPDESFPTQFVNKDIIHN
jgi:hypothetical protein